MMPRRASAQIQTARAEQIRTESAAPADAASQAHRLARALLNSTGRAVLIAVPDRERARALAKLLLDGFDSVFIAVTRVDAAAQLARRDFDYILVGDPSWCMATGGAERRIELNGVDTDAELVRPLCSR